MDASTPSGAIQLIDSLAGSQSWHDFELGVQDYLPDLIPPLSLGESKHSSLEISLAWAFGYVIEVEREGKRPHLAILPHYVGPRGEQSPPDLKEVDDEAIETWARISSEITGAPFAVARLEHLLFAVRHSSARKHAESAIAAYRAAAKGWSHLFDQARDLEIALRLARAIRFESLAREIIEELKDGLNRTLSSSEHLAGVAFRFANPILEDTSSTPEDITYTLDKIDRRYVSDVHTRDDVLNAKLGFLKDPAIRRSLHAARVDLWLIAANESTGITKSGWLKRALEFAVESGQPELVDLASSALQNLSREDLDLTRIASSVSVDPTQVERVMSPVVDAETWQEALTVFSRFGPVSGEVETNRAQVARTSADAPLQAILPREIIGGDGLPRYLATSDEDRARVALARHEEANISFWAPWLAWALLEVARKHGLPSEADLASHFERSPIVSTEMAHALARAYIRFWTGDYEGAAFTASPRIEALARRLLIETNAGVYRLQRNRSPGQYPGLGVLLGLLLERGLDESWYRFLTTVNTSVEGLNLRNEIAHGFVDSGGSPLAVLVLQSAAFLTSLGPESSDSQE